MYKNNQLIMNHVKENVTVYVFIMTLFLVGVIFGAIIVNSMTFIQKQDLYFYLERFFTQLNGDYTVAYTDLLKRSFFSHIKYLLLFFLLGLTIIGLPIVWGLTFIKGLVVGFSVGFIVNQLGVKGLFLATVSIAPQNLITIPIYIVAASLAMMFSLNLFHKIFGRRQAQSITRPMLQYSMAFIVLFSCSFVSSLVETFISNEALKALLRTELLYIIYL